MKTIDMIILKLETLEDETTKLKTQIKHLEDKVYGLEREIESMRIKNK
jgi:cell division protein FtsB